MTARAGADLVIHTAALSWRINCLGTRHVLDAAARAGVGRPVHLSSIVAFGFDYPNGVPYVDTKIAREQTELHTHAAGEVSRTIVRPGDVYGPGSHFWTVSPMGAITAGRLVLPAPSPHRERALGGAAFRSVPAAIASAGSLIAAGRCTSADRNDQAADLRSTFASSNAYLRSSNPRRQSMAAPYCSRSC
ncbi:MAG: NAD-dependent epimerase/dehydratase family protein [Candidatus Binatia bacterium]